MGAEILTGGGGWLRMVSRGLGVVSIGFGVGSCCVMFRDEGGVGIGWDEFGEECPAASLEVVEGCWREETRTPSLVK